MNHIRTSHIYLYLKLENKSELKMQLNSMKKQTNKIRIIVHNIADPYMWLFQINFLRFYLFINNALLTP